MSKHVGENWGKLYFQYFKFQKRHNSFKNKRKLTTLKLDRMFIRRKWHTKFQFNMSKHVGEKCRKLWLKDGDPDGWTDGHHHTIIRDVPSEDGHIKKMFKKNFLSTTIKTFGLWIEANSQDDRPLVVSEHWYLMSLVILCFTAHFLGHH